MPVDMDHALDRRNRSEAPAAGWLAELATRENGVWARIAWTPTGRAKIEGRECRFISPVVMVTKAGEVMAIKRAGRPGHQHSFPWAGRAWQAAPRRLSIKAASGAAPERTGVFRQLGLDE